MSFGERCDAFIPEIPEKPLNYYMERVLPKTSALFEFLFISGALIQGQSSQIISKYALLGRNFGNIYQIYNDLHDVPAVDSARSLNSIGRVTFSLPVAMALRNRDNSKEYRILKESLGKVVEPDKARVIQSYLMSKSVLAESRLFAKKQLKRTFEYLYLVNNSQRSPLEGFLEWIQQENCWNQLEFEKAGY